MAVVGVAHMGMGMGMGVHSTPGVGSCFCLDVPLAD